MAVLVTVVVVGKLGETPPRPLPSAAAVALASAAATATAGQTVQPLDPRETLAVPRPTFADGTPLVGMPVGLRDGSDRFDDGIPAIVDGRPVLRVREAAALPIGSDVMVGGWFSRFACLAPAQSLSCPFVLSDLPYVSARAAVVALGGMVDFDPGRGARVFEATVASDRACTFTAMGECRPRLAITDVKWTGDRQTETSPYRPTELLDGLAGNFPTIDFQAFVEASSCPVAWPAQSYVASSADVPRVEWQALDVRLVLAFPTQDDRLAAEPDLRASVAAMTPFDASNRCVAIPGGVDYAAWMVRQNVMILLGPADQDVRVAVDKVLDALPAIGSS